MIAQIAFECQRVVIMHELDQLNQTVFINNPTKNVQEIIGVILFIYHKQHKVLTVTDKGLNYTGV